MDGSQKIAEICVPPVAWWQTPHGRDVELLGEIPVAWAAIERAAFNTGHGTTWIRTLVESERPYWKVPE